MQCNYVRYQFTFVMDCKPCFNVILMVTGWVACSSRFQREYVGMNTHFIARPTAVLIDLYKLSSNYENISIIELSNEYKEFYYMFNCLINCWCSRKKQVKD